MGDIEALDPEDARTAQGKLVAGRRPHPANPEDNDVESLPGNVAAAYHRNRSPFGSKSGSVWTVAG